MSAGYRGLRCEEFDRCMNRSIGVVVRGTSVAFRPIGCLRITMYTGATYDVLADQAVSELKWVEQELGLVMKC